MVSRTSACGRCCATARSTSAATASERPRPIRGTGLRARRQEVELLSGAVPVTINDDDRERLLRLGVTAYTIPLAITPPDDEALGRAGGAAPGAADDEALRSAASQAAGGAGGEPLGPTNADSPESARAQALRRVERAGGPLRLLFVGSYLHAPNREAARFLVRRLAPALRAASLPFHLTLAGRSAPDWLLHSTGDDISVLPDVPDLAPLYRAADVVLAPLAHGGGTKNKTLEAMAWGLPVVGTPQAFTGVAVAAGAGYLRVPLRAAEIVRALRAIATDPARRELIGRVARRYVLAAHAPELAQARAAALFDAVAAGGGVAEAEVLWAVRRPASAADAERPGGENGTGPETTAAADGAGNSAATS
jgi:hypothetical protein